MKLLKIWPRLQKHSLFGANAALTAATNLGVGALGTVTGMLAARLLGPHGRGELAAIQTYPTQIGYLSLIGTGAAVIYYSARDSDRAGRYVGTALVISLVASLAFIAGAYACMPLLLSAQTPQIVTAASWYLLDVPIIALMSLWLFALRGRSEFVAWNALRTLPTLAWLVIVVFTWVDGLKDPRYLAAAYLVAQAALLIPMGMVAKRYIPGSFAPDARQFKPMLVYGAPCVASNFPLMLNLRLDQMLMAGLLSPGLLGLYVVAVTWSSAINPLMNAISSVLLPKIAGHEAEADRWSVFSRGSRLAALLALLTTPVLVAATPWGLTLLFGRSFQAAIPAALILVPAGAVAALNTVMEDGFRGLGMPAAPLYAELAGVATTVVGLYFLLRPMGIVGASIASLLGYATVMIALLVQVRWLTGESPAALLIPTTNEVQAGMKRLALLARNMVPVISRA
jgi:O-antigen/teichoic acid export membrane protein